jgi:predicted HicB family RNase H-like nuclease
MTITRTGERKGDMKKSATSGGKNKVQSPEQETTVRFTVDLPQSLHRKFSILAAKQGRDKAVIVREWLEEISRHVEE